MIFYYFIKNTRLLKYILLHHKKIIIQILYFQTLIYCLKIQFKHFMDYKNHSRYYKSVKNKRKNIKNQYQDFSKDERYEIKPEYLKLFESIDFNLSTDNKTNNPPKQFKKIQDLPVYNDLFIEASTEIDIYKETILRRIKTREDWNKQPKQIIEDIAGFKPSIIKKLNQLVKGNEKIVVDIIMNIKNIEKKENIIILCSLLFQKSRNEKTFNENLINVLQLINETYKKKYNIKSFIQTFNTFIIDFIPEIKNIDWVEAEIFGIFLNNYMKSNIETPEEFYKIIVGLMENYNINIFHVIFKILIQEEEKIIETIELAEKTEIIKKKFNVLNPYVVSNYYNKPKNGLNYIFKTIKDNESLYSGRNRFLYMEIKDIYKKYGF